VIYLSSTHALNVLFEQLNYKRNLIILSELTCDRHLSISVIPERKIKEREKKVFICLSKETTILGPARRTNKMTELK